MGGRTILYHARSKINLKKPQPTQPHCDKSQTAFAATECIILHLIRPLKQMTQLWRQANRVTVRDKLNDSFHLSKLMQTWQISLLLIKTFSHWINYKEWNRSWVNTILTNIILKSLCSLPKGWWQTLTSHISAWSKKTIVKLLNSLKLSWFVQRCF